MLENYLKPIMSQEQNVSPHSRREIQDLAGRQIADSERRFLCRHCNKGFQRGEHLRRHWRTHTHEKPYECQLPSCTKRFARSDELKRHARLHSKVRRPVAPINVQELAHTENTYDLPHINTVQWYDGLRSFDPSRKSSHETLEDTATDNRHLDIWNACASHRSTATNTAESSSTYLISAQAQPINAAEVRHPIWEADESKPRQLELCAAERRYRRNMALTHGDHSSISSISGIFVDRYKSNRKLPVPVQLPVALPNINRLRDACGIP